MFEHGVSLRSSSANPPSGYFKDLPIEKQYDQQWHVKCGTCGEYLITEVLTDHALLFVDAFQVFRVFPTELRGQRHDECHAPHNDDHAHDSPAVSRVDIIHIGDGPVPVGQNRFRIM